MAKSAFHWGHLKLQKKLTRHILKQKESYMNSAQSNDVNRCLLCKRILKNRYSIANKYGPDCLRRAVKAGTAPLDALDELKAWQRTNKRTAKRNADQATQTKCSNTADLFEQLKAAALDDLNKAITACQSVGITVTLNIEEL